jgi:hypothetical protein
MVLVLLVPFLIRVKSDIVNEFAPSRYDGSLPAGRGHGKLVAGRAGISFVSLASRQSLRAIELYRRCAMRILTAVAIAALLAGCATASPPPGTQTFTGEVWTWDEKDSTVTLWQNGGRVRVKTTPDQIRALQLHTNTRVTGTLAPPADLLVVGGPAGPVTAVPKGQPEVTELKGNVASVDPSGRLAINSERGPVHVWVAAGADQRFKVGEAVTIRSSVQPVDLVAASVATVPTPAPVGTPSASPSSEPGDHAVVTGRIMGINPGGVLVVESPSGPIQVVATDGSRYRIGDAVQVRTTVRTAS